MIEINKYLRYNGKRFIILPEIKKDHCFGCYFDSESGTDELCPKEECENTNRSDNTNIIYVLDPFKYGK